MNKIWAKLAEKYPFLIDLLVKAKTFTMPGFDGIPLYDVFRFFIVEIKANSLPNRSKAIAFSFFLAIFPALIFIFSLIPYIPYLNDMDRSILKFLKDVLPNKETYMFIKSFIEPLLQDISKHKRSGLLTGSIFLVLFLTSNGVMAMLSSFDKTHDHYKRRNAIQTRITALKITALIILLFLFSIVLIVLGQNSLEFLMKLLHITNRSEQFFLSLLRYLFIILMFFFAISFIYYYGPATKKKYKFMSTGATVATTLSIIVSVAFSYWVNNFSRLNVIFGSIGTVMLLLIWLNINAFILLVGYEINASIHYNANLRTKELEVDETKES